MSTQTPTLSPPDQQIPVPPRVDLPTPTLAPAPKRRRRWGLIIGAIVSSFVLLAAVGAYLDHTALRHDLLPMETFDNGTGSFDVTPYTAGSEAWAVYRGGAYVVGSSNEAVAGGTASLTRTAWALRFAVDVTEVTGSGSIVLTCAGDYEGDAFVLAPDGTASVFRAVPGGDPVTLGEARYTPFGSGETHHLLISCLSPGPYGSGYVEGWIDGSRVVRGTDTGPRLDIYAAGLKISGDSMEVRFDNAVGGLDETVK